jgi:hypothetical protein
MNPDLHDITLHALWRLRTAPDEVASPETRILADRAAVALAAEAEQLAALTSLTTSWRKASAVHARHVTDPDTGIMDSAMATTLKMCADEVDAITGAIAHAQPPGQSMFASLDENRST